MARDAEFFGEYRQVLGRIYSQGFYSVELEPAQERAIVAANIDDQILRI